MFFLNFSSILDLFFLTCTEFATNDAFWHETRLEWKRKTGWISIECSKIENVKKNSEIQQWNEVSRIEVTGEEVSETNRFCMQMFENKTQQECCFSLSFIRICSLFQPVERIKPVLTIRCSTPIHFLVFIYNHLKILMRFFVLLHPPHLHLHIHILCVLSLMWKSCPTRKCRIISRPLKKFLFVFPRWLLNSCAQNNLLSAVVVVVVVVRCFGLMMTQCHTNWMQSLQL